jgi:hypothetical protein
MPPTKARRRGDHFIEPGPLIDPSRNVDTLVAKAEQRLDELREQGSTHILQLISEHNQYIEKISDLRASFQEKLADKETQRLDAIRARDQDAILRDAEVAEIRATALANQVTQSAEAQRAASESQRITTADALTATIGPLSARIDGLLAAQFAQQGEKAAKSETRQQANWSTTTTVAVVFGAIASLIAVLAVLASIAVGIYVVAHTNSKNSTSPSISCSVAAAGQACVK